MLMRTWEERKTQIFMDTLVVVYMDPLALEILTIRSLDPRMRAVTLQDRASGGGMRGMSLLADRDESSGGG